MGPVQIKMLVYTSRGNQPLKPKLYEGSQYVGGGLPQSRDESLLDCHYEGK